MGAEESKAYHQKSQQERAKWNLNAGNKPKLHEPDFRPPSTKPYNENRRRDEHTERQGNERTAYYEHRDRGRRKDGDVATDHRSPTEAERREDINRKENRQRSERSPRPRYRSNSDSSVFVAKSRGRKHARRRPSPRPERSSKSPAVTETPRRKERDKGGDKSARRKEKRSHGSRDNRKKMRDQPTNADAKAQEVKSEIPRAKSPTRTKKSKSKTKHGKKSKRKKAKGLDKTNAAYHSAPDLTNITDSKVGAWLNGNAYYWPPQDNQSTWSYPYNFPFAPFLPAHAGKVDGESPAQREIVDGMGYPITPMYATGPNGTLRTISSKSPDGTMRGVHADMQNASAQQAPPFFYPSYPYFIPPQYFFPQAFLQTSGQAESSGYPLPGRSRSQEHGEFVKQGIDGGESEKKRNKQQKNAKARRNGGEPKFIGAAHSTDDLRYRANQAIEVDDVKLASVVVRNQRVTSPISSTSSSKDSLSDSSFNDITIDDATGDDVHMFQPVSKREIFFDDAPSMKSARVALSTHGEDTDDEDDDNSDAYRQASDQVARAGKKQDASISGASTTPVETLPTSPGSETNQPIMTLCERESIVATSFLTNGGKVFCLTRSKSDAIGNKKISESSSSSGSNIDKGPDQAMKKLESPKTDGMWFGLTGSPSAPRIFSAQPQATKRSATLHLNSTTREKSRSLHALPAVSGAQHQTAATFYQTTGSEMHATQQKVVTAAMQHQQSSENVSYAKQPTFSSSQRTTFSRYEPSPSSTSSPSHPQTISTNGKTSSQVFGQNSVTTSQQDLLEGRLFPAGSRQATSNSNMTYESYRSLNEYNESTEESRGPNIVISYDDDNDVFETSIPSRKKSSGENAFLTNSGDSSSSDSDDVRYRSNSSLTNKLVRIDSHDSLTMRRRIRSHRRLSQNEGFDRRATIGSISKQDFLKAQSSVSGEAPSPVNPFRNADSADISSFLSKAKSEEQLRDSLSKSTEEIMVKWKPRQNKETLQERAARILGLTSQQLVKAKQKAAAAPKKTQSSQSPPQPAPRQMISANDDVTNSEAVSESFAVSVTSSMIDKRPEKYTVLNVKPHIAAENQDDVSTLSACSSLSSSSEHVEENSHSLDGDHYTVHVSDSVLDVEVPCSVRPHPRGHHSPAEYKLPDNLLKSYRAETTKEVFDAPAGLAATYSNSIYDRTLEMPNFGQFSRQYSDDTSESESLGRSLSSTTALDDTAEQVGVSSSSSFKHDAANAVPAFSSETRKPLQRHRIAESPVPVASYSAPLTPVELDIVMQLYNSADETASNGSDTEKRQRKFMPSKNDAMKLKVAKAIGFDPDALSQRMKPTEPEMARVEDLDIKVFPGSSRASSTTASLPFEADSSSKTGDKENQGDVLKAMQSLGLDPDQSWIVSL